MNKQLKIKWNRIVKLLKQKQRNLSAKLNAKKSLSRAKNNPTYKIVGISKINQGKKSQPKYYTVRLENVDNGYIRIGNIPWTDPMGSDIHDKKLKVNDIIKLNNI